VKLLPDRLRRYIALPPGNPDDVIPGAVGKDDPDDLGGQVDALGSDREVNPDLVGGERYRNLDSMVMSDPVVSGGLLSIKLPMGAAEWKLQAASEDPVDEVIADAARRQFGLDEEADSWLAGGWDALLWQSLLHLDYGSMTQEIVWRDEPVTWRDRDGDEHPLLVIDRMGPRYPHALDRYKPGPGPGQPLASVHQWGVKNALPGGKLVHLVHAPHLSRFTGSSILRPAYGVWKLKRKMIVSAAVGFDRFASGVPIVRSPGTGGAEEERLARGIGRDYKNHERSYFWLKGRKPGNGEAGWDVEVLNGSGTLADPIPQLRHYDEQMVSAILGRFFMLGSTDVGSRAVGEVLSEPFYQALNWHAGRVARELTQQLVAKWVRVNFGEDVAVPRITCGTIQQKNLPVKGEFLAQASAAGVTFQDREAQNTIRAWADVPPLPEDWPLAPPTEGTSPAPGTRRVIGPRQVEAPTAPAEDTPAE
jgi:hypothetical protein